jgi:hypothetical protein
MGKKKKQNRPASQLANKSNKYQKRQQRYIEKKRNEKIAKVPDKLSKIELEKWKLQLEPLVSEANKRIEMIQAAGYTSYALDRVIREGGKDYFDLDDVSTREQLLREMTRLRVFINDKGSTVETAKLETAQIYSSQYAGKFGNEFNNEENQFARYDIKAIDKDVAARAFESYRKIEEHRATEIIGDGAYGSENLIIALYDAEIRGKDSLTYGEDLLDTFVQTSNAMWDKTTKDANLISGITGIIEDNITGGYLF